MNYLYLLLETFAVMSLMLILYVAYKKNGLYFFIAIFSSLFSIVIGRHVEIMSFDVNVGIALIMGIFICSNIIIQRFGIDEVKKIVLTFIFSYVISFLFTFLVSYINCSDYNLLSNYYYDEVFGYNFGFFRIFMVGLLVIPLILIMNSYIYYFYRRTQNKLWLSNILSLFITQFIHSILFVLFAYIGSYNAFNLFGMILVRYLVMIIIGIIGLLPVYVIVKMKDGR